MKRLAWTIVALILSGSHQLLAETQASGTFKGNRISFEVTGAYAFWSRSPGEPLIEVAIANDEFGDAYDAFYDPAPVIQSTFVDERTVVAYFEFEPNGKYHGVSYQLAAGDSCGFCYDPGVKSTVRFRNGRAQGGLSFTSKNRTFDVHFDVPVAPREWGSPLPAGGGEPGATYSAYSAAMTGSDRKAIFDALDDFHRGLWHKYEKQGNLEEWLDYRLDKVHWRIVEPRVVEGFMRGDQAILLIQAHSKLLDHVHGQVALTREAGRWRISDEIYEVGE